MAIIFYTSPMLCRQIITLYYLFCLSLRTERGGNKGSASHGSSEQSKKAEFILCPDSEAVSTSWQVLRVLRGPSLSQLAHFPKTCHLAASDLQTLQEGNCWKEWEGEWDVFLALFLRQFHQSPHIKVFHMLFSVSACHFKLSVTNWWMALLSSPGLIHIPPQLPEKVEKSSEKCKRWLFRI